MRMRIKEVVYCLGAMSFVAAGCGDDDSSPADPDAMPVVDDPDAAPVVDETWKTRTSGEIRFERRILSTGDPRQIVEAYFHHGQEPGRLGGAEIGHCVDVFAFTTGPNAGFVQDTRTYDNVGSSVTLDNGIAPEIILEPNEDTNDFRGLSHPLIYVQNGLSVNGVTPDQVTVGSQYTVTLEDSTLDPVPITVPIPETPITTGGNIALADDGVAAGANVLDPTIDLVWEFDAPEEDNVNLAFLVFTNGGPTTGGEAWLCADLVSKGKVTVPALLTKAFPRTGTVFGATFGHNVVEWNGGSLDVLGFNCLNGAYSFNDP